MAPIGRTLRIARPAAGRLMLATLLGAGAIGAAIGLMGTSAWLISRSAQHPAESAIAVAVVAVQFFGLSRGFFRYGERLVGHDAAFRALAELRMQVYQRLERLAPAGLPAFHSGDLLARFVGDVDSLQDLMLRVVPPFGIAGVVGAATVALMWWILPGAGLILMLALLAAATIVPWLTGLLARRSESRQAGLRGELAASVIDLVEGAPELVVYGVAGAQAQKIRAVDAELTAAAAASARTSGIGLGLATLFAGLATWGAVVVGIPAGSRRPAQRSPAGGDRPGTDGRLRAGGWPPGGHPGAATYPALGGPGVRRNRCAGAGDRPGGAVVTPTSAL